jgi:hypothetical protein
MSPRNFDKITKNPIPKDVIDKIDKDDTLWTAFAFLIGIKPSKTDLPSKDIYTTRENTDRSTYN